LEYESIRGQSPEYLLLQILFCLQRLDPYRDKITYRIEVSTFPEPDDSIPDGSKFLGWHIAKWEDNHDDGLQFLDFSTVDIHYNNVNEMHSALEEIRDTVDNILQHEISREDDAY